MPQQVYQRALHSLAYFQHFLVVELLVDHAGRVLVTHEIPNTLIPM